MDPDGFMFRRELVVHAVTVMLILFYTVNLIVCLTIDMYIHGYTYSKTQQ